MNDLAKSVKHVMTVFLVFFIALISYIAYFQLIKSPKINEMAGNTRVIAKKNEVLRGTIYDRNGTALTTSERLNQTSQKRDYLYGNLYVHALGYTSAVYGTTGLEEEYDSELTTYNAFGNNFRKFLDTIDLNGLVENIKSDKESTGSFNFTENFKEFKDKIDLFIGGSPCQSFSISGKRLGLEDTRGTLFYEYARLVDEMQPKVFIYENVPGMLNHDKGNTWKVISEIFDSLNYSWKLYSLKATDFGIPQNRTRIFVIGFKNSLGIDPNDIVLETKELDVEVKDFLEEYVDDKYYHGEKGFKWITKPLSLKKRVSINSKIARTQAANQQFNWCGDMIFESNPTRIFPSRVYHGVFNGEYGVARKLTPRE